MRLLYDGPHIQVLERTGSSDYVLVTFAEMGMRADGRTIWAQSLVDRLDLSAVGFVAKAPNWYPAADLARACAAALPALAGFETRIGYGFSQGAHAAIRASRPLGLTHTIAVSPQDTIDPAAVADQRFARFFVPDLHEGMGVTAADDPQALHLFHDPGYRDDDEQARRILAVLPGAHAHPMPFTDHGTIRVLADGAAFPALIAAVVAGRPEAIASRLRRASPVRAAAMVHRAAAAGRTARALALFEATRFTGARRTLLLADLAEGGATTQALATLEADLRHRPDDALTRAALAVALAVLGQADAAREQIEVALRGTPHGRVRGLVERAEQRLAAQRAPVAPAPPSRLARWSRATSRLFWRR